MAGGALAGSLLTIWAARGGMCANPREQRDHGRSEKPDGVEQHEDRRGAGDGIGNEVVPEGIKVLEAVERRFGLDYAWDTLDWSCERFAKTGAMMPADGLEQIAKHDAIYLGAVGWPGVPDHVSLWGLLIPIRRGFQQYINLRPVRLFEGLKSRWPIASPATSTTGSCARTTRASIPRSAGACTKAPSCEAAIQRRCSPRRAASA